jgi:hypothetical protein
MKVDPKKLIPSLVSIIPLLMAPFSEQLTTLIQSNPYAYMAVQTALTILANLTNGIAVKK